MLMLMHVCSSTAPFIYCTDSIAAKMCRLRFQFVFYGLCSACDKISSFFVLFGSPFTCANRSGCNVHFLILKTSISSCFSFLFLFFFSLSRTHFDVAYVSFIFLCRSLFLLDQFCLQSSLMANQIYF